MSKNKKSIIGSLLLVLFLVLVIPSQSPAITKVKGSLVLSGNSDPECHCPGDLEDCICVLPDMPKD